MPRAWAPRALVALLLACLFGALAAPGAASAGGAQSPHGMTAASIALALPLDQDDLRDAGEDAPPEALLGSVAGAGVVLLGVALLLARRAGRPIVVPPPRWTLDAGRVLAARRRPVSVEEALACARRDGVGRIKRAQAHLDAVDLEVRRRKRHPCARTRGYLQALFEATWADSVQVEHPGCTGRRGTCTYRVRRTHGSGVTTGGAPATGASIPGSRNAPRRSTRAPNGGG